MFVMTTIRTFHAAESTADRGNPCLFNPRRDRWDEHFAYRGGGIVGRTPTGRATVRLLQMNAPRRVELREEWLKENGLL